LCQSGVTVCGLSCARHSAFAQQHLYPPLLLPPASTSCAYLPSAAMANEDSNRWAGVKRVYTKADVVSVTFQHACGVLGGPGGHAWASSSTHKNSDT
jgi:hypothetical protein